MSHDQQDRRFPLKNRPIVLGHEGAGIVEAVGAEVTTVKPGDPVVAATLLQLQQTTKRDLPPSQSPHNNISITVTDFSLTIANLFSVTAGTLANPGTITITPDQTTLVTISMATLTVIPLNLTATITGPGNTPGVTITQTGFTIASLSLAIPSITLGGVLSLTTPTITLTNLTYTYGGSLSGTLGFSAGAMTGPPGAALELAQGLSVSAQTLTGSYNFGSGVLNVTLAPFDLDLSFVNFQAASAALSYTPGTGNSGSTLLVGLTGVTIFVGAAGVGVQVTDGTLALAVFDTSTAPGGTITYALQATGTVSLVGPTSLTNVVTLSGNVEVQFNNTGATVNQVVDISSGHPSQSVAQRDRRHRIALRRSCGRVSATEISFYFPVAVGGPITKSSTAMPRTSSARTRRSR